MRASQIFLCVITMALFISACGEESAAPTATTAPATEIAPTAMPTSSMAPENTATPVPTPTVVAPERDLDIQTLLPPDAIRSIDSPTFFETIEEADTVYDEGEYVLGVEIDGDARAYSVPLLSSHEIVNDTVAGIPIAVTW